MIPSYSQIRKDRYFSLKGLKSQNCSGLFAQPYELKVGAELVKCEIEMSC
jgi:hypothetical protein